MVSRQLAILALAAALAGTGAVAGDDVPRTISVAAEGRVEAVPDMAVISLGVVNEAATAGTAMAATSAAAARVLDRLVGFGIEPRDIQTSQLTLNPVWSNAANEGRSKITGFSATNALTVRVRDLDRLGEIMDAVIEDGANDFNGLSFAVAEPAPRLQEDAPDVGRRRRLERARLGIERHDHHQHLRIDVIAGTDIQRVGFA